MSRRFQTLCREHTAKGDRCRNPASASAWNINWVVWQPMLHVCGVHARRYRRFAAAGHEWTVSEWEVPGLCPPSCK